MDRERIDDELSGLADREGWRIEDDAARVHYEGASDRYSVEYYPASECVVYWKVPVDADTDTACPVARATVPTPLRERIRADLQAAGVDPECEHRSL